MGILNFIRGQAIDIISWLDDSNNTLCWRFPDSDNEIKQGAKLIVREGQVAIFVSEGQMGDVFQPGTYTLRTQNIPILTSLQSWKYGFESPFKAEVYFINTKQYIDMKWGTMNPIPMRDADFGIVRVRAFGIYAIKVTDAPTFFKTYVGTDHRFTTEEIEGQLRRTLVSSFTNTLGQAKIPVLDLAGNYDTLGGKLQEKMDPEFRKGGITLTKFLIENISLPPEVEKAIDTRSSMGAVGNLGQFAQYQAAQSMRDAAQNPGGAGTFAGMGAGIAMGQVFTQSMGNAMSAPPPPPESQYYVNGPNGQSGPMTASAAASVVRDARGASATVWAPGMSAWQPWQQVSAIASLAGPPSGPPAGPPPVAGGPPPLAASAEPTFHYSSGSQPEGPYPLAELVARIKANPGGTHKVWRDGMPSWSDAKSVPEIAGRLGGGPPPLS